MENYNTAIMIIAMVAGVILALILIMAECRKKERKSKKVIKTSYKVAYAKSYKFAEGVEVVLEFPVSGSKIERQRDLYTGKELTCVRDFMELEKLYEEKQKVFLEGEK